LAEGLNSGLPRARRSSVSAAVKPVALARATTDQGDDSAHETVEPLAGCGQEGERIMALIGA
jgi:hypothetical protein